MLFIDQPTQTGLSYDIPVPAYTDPVSQLIVPLEGNFCPDWAQDFSCGTYSYPNESLTSSTTPQGAPNFWATLQGFMGAFPQYSREEFYFTTESYGGHYGPIYNEYIEQQNAKNIPGAKKISLTGVLIGNGWYDPLIQYQVSHIVYTYSVIYLIFF
jgi:carboxypeptidase D